MKKLLVFLFVILLFFGFVGLANATLYNRGGGLIYDSALDITWLQDANYAYTSMYDDNGLMTWNDAVGWASTLSYYDSVRDVTWDDWRLPITPGTVIGYGLNEGEMGYLYTSEGITASSSGFFSNLQLSRYWSGTEYDTGHAWYFIFGNGYQQNINKDYWSYAWAVRDGDVSPVPEPATMLLLGSGLAGLFGFRRKLRKR